MLDYQHQKDWPDFPSTWQSPIKFSLEKAKKVKLDECEVKFTATYEFSKVTAKGNNLQYDGKGQTLISGRYFTFQQLHFHLPAEHLLEGTAAYPLELHFVQKNEVGQLAVIAFFVEVGDYNEALAPFFQHFKLQEGAGADFKQHLDVNKLLTKKANVYRYLGSLTTPPLLRGVEWWVFEQPLAVSKQQLQILQKDFTRPNARAVQPRNERNILYYDLQ
ncbi:carbonic anhydrase family protein [Liquorilactobacillus oeni]|uniref:carbonic anhydrase n=1 Tax=Liquorilactobacillus oeni DSM 19972 TaxID=1423777 RepID=A0A0R1MC55_9LACO|nr:carbonic anhydrase family protein [Liquorilactobacillus oeni]KRL05679.1 carbonate dehydratase [Liquorilactobacillus oeni DSM 19972]